LGAISSREDEIRIATNLFHLVEGIKDLIGDRLGKTEEKGARSWENRKDKEYISLIRG
jgi:hypothetical protein